MHWLGLAAVGVLLAAIGGILAISAGLTDPTPAVLPTRSIALEPLSLPATAEQINWLVAESAASYLTIRLTAAWESGDPDAAYGLVLGEPNRYLAAAVSATGYISLWLYEGDRVHYLLPWQTWTHVQAGAAGNEIQIERQEHRIIVRINREQLWTGSYPVAGTQIGVVAQSFNDPTTIRFEQLQIMSQPAEE
ncbi:MAG: hypothetical protein Fur0021_12990 [Candidatus Promineifilaceae bacterium]